MSPWFKDAFYRVILTGIEAACGAVIAMGVLNATTDVNVDSLKEAGVVAAVAFASAVVTGIKTIVSKALNGTASLMPPAA